MWPRRPVLLQLQHVAEHWHSRDPPGKPKLERSSREHRGHATHQTLAAGGAVVCGQLSQTSGWSLPQQWYSIIRCRSGTCLPQEALLQSVRLLGSAQFLTQQLQLEALSPSTSALATVKACLVRHVTMHFQMGTFC